MTYTDHLRSVIEALLIADPKLSAARLSTAAGLGTNWVSTFLARRAGTLGRADEIVAACRRLCPEGRSGEPVRHLLEVFDEMVEGRVQDADTAPVPSAGRDAA